MIAVFADLSTLEWVYLALFCSGLLYALFLAVFGLGQGHSLEHGGFDVGDGGFDVDHGGFDVGDGGFDVGDGGFDVDHGGLDVDHGIDTGHGSDISHGLDVGYAGQLDHRRIAGKMARPSPWNPLVIATFIGGFGGFGILGTRLMGIPSFLSLIVALPAGLVLAGLIFACYTLLLAQGAGSSAATWQEVRGASGQVLTPIPEKGLGEVVYVARGTQFVAPARAIDGRAIPRGTKVTVLDMDNVVAVVDVRFAD